MLSFARYRVDYFDRIEASYERGYTIADEDDDADDEDYGEFMEDEE